MAIEHYVWTAHARQRIQQRRLDRKEVEQAISQGHDAREVNDGRAQWLVRGTTADGTSFEAIYDHPHGGNVETARIVSVWRLL
jgi:ribosomal protein L2